MQDGEEKVTRRVEREVFKERTEGEGGKPQMDEWIDLCVYKGEQTCKQQSFRLECVATPQSNDDARRRRRVASNPIEMVFFFVTLRPA